MRKQENIIRSASVIDGPVRLCLRSRLADTPVCAIIVSALTIKLWVAASKTPKSTAAHTVLNTAHTVLDTANIVSAGKEVRSNYPL